ncbi:hypothetical protein G3O08_17140 [Cryomorpha ignava]|uniref:Uncharacterized protein n=1 Tax=Cryomorpha ignava TaxID=101383 RepID=A0A7K3WUP2_9FLAO|nr:hypothetical protein [Cryomorpha ignava]NEN25224.1 hypothetical protein [Cryomorpha ignava]
MKQKSLLFALLIIILWSCASLGSKTLYIDETAKLPEQTKIIISQPTTIHVDQPIDEVHEVLTFVITEELAEYNFIIEKYNGELPSFSAIDTLNDKSIITSLNADYVLSAKIELLKSMNQTRDCKVEYKLVSTKTGKLTFHSKYNTTVGASTLVLPGIKDYPDTDRIMLVGMSSGLHQFENKLMRK